MKRLTCVEGEKKGEGRGREEYEREGGREGERHVDRGLFLVQTMICYVVIKAICKLQYCET